MCEGADKPYVTKGEKMKKYANQQYLIVELKSIPIGMTALITAKRVTVVTGLDRVALYESTNGDEWTAFRWDGSQTTELSEEEMLLWEGHYDLGMESK